MMAPITADELNYIIFRYLQESGFTHTAFNFGYEAGVNKSPIDGNLVPPGALFNIIQKGLKYMMEANTKNDDGREFCFLKPMDLIAKDIHELQIEAAKKKNQQSSGAMEVDKNNEGTPSYVKKKDREKQYKKKNQQLPGAMKVGKDNKTLSYVKKKDWEK